MNCFLGLFFSLIVVALTIRDPIQAGLPVVEAQGAGAVRAAAVLALTADPSSLHPAVLLLHYVITDVWKHREVEITMRRRRGAERGEQPTKNRKALLFSLTVTGMKTVCVQQAGIYLPCRLVLSSLSSGYNTAPSSPLMPLDVCGDSQSACGQAGCLLDLSSNCSSKWGKVT